MIRKNGLELVSARRDVTFAVAESRVRCPAIAGSSCFTGRALRWDINSISCQSLLARVLLTRSAHSFWLPFCRAGLTVIMFRNKAEFT